MKSKKFVGEAFEELTIDEMRMVQGSGDVETEGNNYYTIVGTVSTIPIVASHVLATLNKKC